MAGVHLKTHVLQVRNNHTYEWFEIAPDDEIILHREFAALSDFLPSDPQDKVVVLIPGEYVTATALKLPKMRASEKLQAIQYALEEQLASDPEDAFIVQGDLTATGDTTVIVIDQQYLEAMHQSFEALHFSPRCILPDFLALSWEPDTWTVFLLGQMALVRTGLQTGFSADQNNLALYLKLILGKESQQKPTRIVIWQKDTAIDLAEFEKLSIPIELKVESQKNYFDKNLFVKPAINFLQGRYRPKSHSSGSRRNWIVCGALFASIIAFLFLSNVIELFYYRHQSAALQKQVLKTYQQIFPGVTEVQEARFRVGLILKEMEGVSSRNIFLRVLNTVGQTLVPLSGITMQSVTFSDKQIHITVLATNLQLVNQWSQALRAQQLTVKQNVVNAGKNSVKAEIIIGGVA